MPVPHADKNFEVFALLIEHRLDRIRLCLRAFQDRGTPANLAVSLTHFVDDLLRGGAIAAHIHQIGFDLLQIIGTPVRHYQYTDHRWGAFHFSIIFTNGGRIFLALNGYQPTSARIACSFSSVEPQTSEAPKAPSTPENQILETNNEPRINKIPELITYGHQR